LFADAAPGEAGFPFARELFDLRLRRLDLSADFGQPATPSAVADADCKRQIS